MRVSNADRMSHVREAIAELELAEGKLYHSQRRGIPRDQRQRERHEGKRRIQNAFHLLLKALGQEIRL